MTDRFKRLSALLTLVNPFGVVEQGVYTRYMSQKDAYVDIMMKVSTLCPKGYIDIPMVFCTFMGIEMVRAINLCKRRDYEIMHIDMDASPSDCMDKWQQLLKVLLRNTEIAFDDKIFYAAWPEFIHLRMKQDSLNEVIKQKQEKYYDEDSFNTEGDSEQ